LGLLASTLLAAPSTFAEDRSAFTWKDGDRVVLIGDTLIERDQTHGYLETLITANNPDKTITFRNLGWSADSVLGLSRAGFGKPEEGFQQLKEHVLGLKPTVLIVGYGMSASFEGEAGLPAFKSGLKRLLDTLAETRARLILLSPIGHEDHGRPLPDPRAHNEALALYRDAVREIAQERDAWFVDLYEPTLSATDYGIDPLTDNGIHPTAYGYWYLASVIDLELRGQKDDPGWVVTVDVASGKVAAPDGVTIADVKTGGGKVSMAVTDVALPIPPAPPGAPDAVWIGSKREIKVQGLDPGDYTLTIDGQTIATVDELTWFRRVRLDRGPEFDQVEALRRAINAKNALYFHRWRPQNETYLFGFRKHEQGNNAREIPLFDPLVEAKEKEIARLKVPVRRRYEVFPAR
ncbi:MAG: SGNH/GDSL hydrolase family protein, partial [Isosphaeraceae bacterium]